jgi:hypothetical protein
MTARTTAEERAEISRQNGRRSRGPVSTEGKIHSRMNAVKHGMTARVPVLPGEDPETFRQHVQGITDSLAPRNPLELALAEQAALSLWKIERAERAEATRVTATLRAAEARADAHQQEELAALGRWLLADSVKAKWEAAEDLLAFLPVDRHTPFRAGRGDPLVILLRIHATADGCGWLLDRWDRLRRGLEQDGGWDIDEMIEAAQLRGQRPLFRETAEWECLLQPRKVEGNPALLEEGRRQLRNQLTGGRAADPAGLAAALLRLVEEEVARLEELKAAHEGREAADRAELADRLAVDATPEGERVRRYQLDCDRKLHRAIQGLLKLRRGEGIGAGDDLAPDGIPATPTREEVTYEPESEGEGTVAVRSGPVDGPESQADPILDPGSGILDSSSPPPDPGSSILDPDAAEPASAGVAAPAGPAARPEGGLVPRHDHEPTTPAAEWIPQNEPGPLVAERTPQNEPGLPVGGDLASQNEPGGPGPMAGLDIPALVCALLILLATGLSAAFAGPVAGPIGPPSMTPVARAGPAVRVGPLPRTGTVSMTPARKTIRRWGLPTPERRVGKPENREGFRAGQYEPGGLLRGNTTARKDRAPLDPIGRLHLA